LTFSVSKLITFESNPLVINHIAKTISSKISGRFKTRYVEVRISIILNITRRLDRIVIMVPESPQSENPLGISFVLKTDD